jgi:hydroxymethylpyrimidine/phosphomethylpyrimidine kinase
VQNTLGVRGRRDVAADFVGSQLDAVLDDLPVAAVKTGLLPDAGVVDVVVDRLRARPVPSLVVDPVLIATSGHALTSPSTLAALRDRLLPLATIVTPNLAEAAALTGRPVRTLAEMRDAAQALLRLGANAILVKGGHLAGRACDVLVAAGEVRELDAARVEVGPTHGTGCTLSAALAAGLASGLPLVDAVLRAKRYVTRAIEASLPLGHGSRPLDHRVRPNDV